MNFLQLVHQRASVRNYSAAPIKDELVNEVLEAGRLAPSAANFQPWHFIVVRDEEQKKILREAYSKDWFWKAPILIVVCIEPAKAWTRMDGKNYAMVDGAIAMDHMTLCAADHGLGTCWIAAFDPAKVKAALNLPDGIEPLVMTPLGKPDGQPAPKKRKAIETGEALKKYVEEGGGLIVIPVGVRYPGHDDEKYWNLVLNPLGTDITREGVADLSRKVKNEW
ncbi:MAG: nitroreductase [Nitrospirales bacterium]|nr:nitroreductase [Nitrospirales bacterium]